MANYPKSSSLCLIQNVKFCAQQGYASFPILLYFYFIFFSATQKVIIRKKKFRSLIHEKGEHKINKDIQTTMLQ